MAATSEEKDIAAAKDCGLGLVDYRILRFLSKNGESTYREIADGAPCSYSPLTKVMRKDHEGSLCQRGLCKEVMVEKENRDILHFEITAKGKQALTKKVKPKKDE